MSNFGKCSWDIENNNIKGFYESGLLKLNCDKARSLLDWHAVLEFDQTIKFTAEWYKEYYSGANMLNFTNRQIEEFVENAKLQNINWIDE